MLNENGGFTKFYIYKDGKLIKETYVLKVARFYKKEGYIVKHRSKGEKFDRKLLQVDK
jgi:hypothetical protein